MPSDATDATDEFENPIDPGVYGTFRLNFHRFDRFELGVRGHTQP